MIGLSKIFNYIFFLLAFLLISDLNSSLSILFNVKAGLSELILLLTAILFFKSFHIKYQLPKLIIYFVSFYVFFLTYGTILYFFKGNDWGNPLERIRSLSPSIFILYTFTKWFLYYLNRNEFKIVINVISFSLMFNSLAIIYSHLTGNIFIPEEYTITSRSSGLIASANQAGTTAVLTQVFMLYLAMRIKISTTKQIVFLCFYLLALFAAVITFSKAAFLNSLILLLLYFYFFFFQFYKKHQHKIQTYQSRKIVFPLLLLLSLFVFGYGNKFLSNVSTEQYRRLEQFSELMKGNINEQTTTNRSTLAGYALDEIKKDNFMGRGLDTFHRMQGNGLGTHNQYLLFIGEIGILGLLLFLIYLSLLYLKILKISELSIKFLSLSIFVILCITAFVSHTLLFVKTYVIMFAFINVIAVSYRELKSRNSISQF